MEKERAKYNEQEEKKKQEERESMARLEMLEAKPIPDETRFSGTWICSPQGRGKTTLLHTMIMADLEKDASIILMDSKGELIEPISKLKSIKDRLIIIDPLNPIALNPLDVPHTNTRTAVSHLEYVFSALLEAKITPKQQSLFRPVLRALLMAFPNPTLETFRDVIANGVKNYQSYIAKLPSDLQDFFNKEFERDYDATRNELIWRLRLLMENDVIRTMFNSPVNKLNLGHAMDEGKVIIIKNSQAILDADGAEFFGRFIIGQVWTAATARSLRPASQKKPCYFYIDEAQVCIRRDEKIAAIIDECRSQKIALTLAHQRSKQIDNSDVLSALSNCAIRYTNSDEEAKFFAPIMRTEPGFLQSLSRGRFAVFVRDLTTHPFILDVIPVDFSQHPTMTQSEVEQLAHETKLRYGVEPPLPGAQPAFTISNSLPKSDVAPPSQRIKKDPSERTKW